MVILFLIVFLDSNLYTNNGHGYYRAHQLQLGVSEPFAGHHCLVRLGLQVSGDQLFAYMLNLK